MTVSDLCSSQHDGRHIHQLNYDISIKDLMFLFVFFLMCVTELTNEHHFPPCFNNSFICTGYKKMEAHHIHPNPLN